MNYSAEDLRDQILKFESEISEKNLLIEKEQRVRNIAEESLSELGRKYDHLLEAEKIYKKEAGELKMKLDETLAAKSFTESSRLKLQQELDTSRVKVRFCLPSFKFTRKVIIYSINRTLPS